MKNPPKKLHRDLEVETLYTGDQLSIQLVPLNKISIGQHIGTVYYST